MFQVVHSSGDDFFLITVVVPLANSLCERHAAFSIILSSESPDDELDEPLPRCAAETGSARAASLLDDFFAARKYSMRLPGADCCAAGFTDTAGDFGDGDVGVIGPHLEDTSSLGDLLRSVVTAAARKASWKWRRCGRKC